MFTHEYNGGRHVAPAWPPLDALGAVDREVRGIQLLMGPRDATPTIYVASIRFTAARPGQATIQSSSASSS